MISALLDITMKYVVKSEIDKSAIKRCKIRAFASFVGLWVSACPVRLALHNIFERCKYLNLKITDTLFITF